MKDKKDYRKLDCTKVPELLMAMEKDLIKSKMEYFIEGTCLYVSKKDCERTDYTVDESMKVLVGIILNDIDDKPKSIH